MRARKLVTGLIIAVIFTVASVAAESTVEVAGWGGCPFSDRLTSLWLTRGPVRSGRPQPLVMVFYVGSSGWHDRKWDIKSQFGKPPSFIKLTSGDVALSIDYSDGHEAKVQGVSVDLGADNIVLVSGVDGPLMTRRVTPLGTMKHDIPEGANPPEYVLNTQPEIRDAVAAATR